MFIGNSLLGSYIERPLLMIDAGSNQMPIEIKDNEY